MYKILKTDGLAKRGELETVHGTIQTPVFMNVGTAAAIKGAVGTEDLQQIKTQVQRRNRRIFVLPKPDRRTRNNPRKRERACDNQQRIQNARVECKSRRCKM